MTSAFEKDKVHCAIGMLMMLDAINDDGSIRPSRVAKLTKPILWSYIFYLQKHNRAKPAFAALGKTNKVTDASLARIVSEAPIKAIRKAQLIAFINRAASAPDALSLPFLSGRKHQQEIVTDFNKHVVDSIERQIDYQFNPILHPAVFESGSGEVKVRMEIHMEKVGKKPAAPAPASATPKAQPRKTRRTQATAE